VSIDQILSRARERALNEIHARNEAFWPGSSTPFSEVTYIRHQMQTGEIFFRELGPNPYTEMGWKMRQSERLDYLNERAIHTLRLLQDQQTSISHESVPADPFSHLLLWLAEKIGKAGVKAWLMRHTKIRKIAVSTSHVQLFLPPWPLKCSDKPYLAWVAEARKDSK
jgi:predicted secreted protein